MWRLHDAPHTQKQENQVFHTRQQQEEQAKYGIE